jgi:hypothetical protein
MYHCDCGHWRCNRPKVSRSTWFRHKLQTILRNQLEADDIDLTEPMPVEEDHMADEEAEEYDGPEYPDYPEVRHIL